MDHTLLSDEPSPAVRLSARLGQYRAAVEAARQEMAEDRIMARIWAGDHTVWQPQPTEITNRLGWLHSPRAMQARVGELEAFAARIEAAGYSDALVLGMGGSSLAPDLMGRVFSGLGLRLAVLDSTDPGAVLAHASRLEPARSLFLVSTKSGSTVETLSLFKYYYGWTASALGADQAGGHFVAITDPGSELEALAGRHRFRAVFLNDPTIGGRNSVLSHFGLVPAALAGVDLNLLLERAVKVMDQCTVETNPAAHLGAIIGELAKAGRDKLTLVISAAVASFGYWVEQLVAESTGKDGRGILPIEGEPLGPPEVYHCDRLFVQLCLAGDKTHDQALGALAQAGHPIVRLDLHDLYDLGGQFALWELATAVASHRLGVNSFNQPNVEAAKRLAQQMVAEYRQRGTLPEVESGPLTAKALQEFLAQARPGDPTTGAGRTYVALQAYLQPTAETDAALLALRTRLRDRYKLATTVGYGPRFLHSTGQLHKGDAGNGLFVQLTASDPQDVPIPDQAGEPDSSITFGVLKAAQALGDRQALLDAGRPVIRFHLGADCAGSIRRLADAC